MIIWRRQRMSIWNANFDRFGHPPPERVLQGRGRGLAELKNINMSTKKPLLPPISITGDLILSPYTPLLHSRASCVPHSGLCSTVSRPCFSTAATANVVTELLEAAFTFLTDSSLIVFTNSLRQLPKNLPLSYWLTTWLCELLLGHESTFTRLVFLCCRDTLKFEKFLEKKCAAGDQII
jgi:hypothetical protein